MPTDSPQRTARLTRGPIGHLLFKMSTPTMVGILIILSFNLVDTYFISLLGTVELAAISFTFPASFVVMNLILGLGMGVSTTLAHQIGQGNSTTAKQIATDALLLSTLIICGVAVIGLVTIKPLFSLIGASDETLRLIKEYMTIWYSFVLFLTIPILGNSVMRATGDTKTPSIIMAIAGLINGVLDPLLIFGWGPIPAFGMQGAAMATVISWMGATIASLYTLVAREKLLAIPRYDLNKLWKSWHPILHVGLPASATNILTPIASGVVTAIIAKQGAYAVAAYGVASKIESIALIVIMALCSSLAPIVSQNLGAGEFQRINETLRKSFFFTSLWGLAIALILYLAAAPLAGIFTHDTDVLATVTHYLCIIPLTYGCQGMIMLTCSALSALRLPLLALALGVLRLFIFGIPLVYVGSEIDGIRGIFFGIALANIIVCILSLYIIRKYRPQPTHTRQETSHYG